MRPWFFNAISMKQCHSEIALFHFLNLKYSRHHQAHTIQLLCNRNKNMTNKNHSKQIHLRMNNLNNFLLCSMDYVSRLNLIVFAGQIMRLLQWAYIKLSNALIFKYTLSQSKFQKIL